MRIKRQAGSVILYKRSPLAVAVIVGVIGLGTAGQAAAFNFDLTEEVSGGLDVTLGYANLFRTENSQTKDWLSRGGRYGGVNDLSEMRVPDAGDLVSQVFSVTGELSLNWRNYGLVTSAAAKYDTEIMDRSMNRGELSNQGLSTQWSKSTRKHAGNPVDLLDAYVWGTFDIGEKPLELRLGKQVVNWGEGLYFLGGVSTQVPLNINKLVTPGAELKEAYIGNNSILAQMGLGDESSISAYYQFEWNRAELPPQGTFYGYDILYRGSGSEIQGGNNVSQLMGAGDMGLPFRLSDKTAKDSGQWGVNFKTTLGDTEYGLYYSRYHATLPVLYGTFGGTKTGSGNILGVDLGQFWPEDQDMFGFSWSTTKGSWSFAGEVAYRPNEVLMGDVFNKGYLNAKGNSGHKNDTVHASVNGMWLGGPTFAGIDSQYALYQLGIDHISGDRSNLALHSTITRESVNTAIKGSRTPDKMAIGAAVNWAGTWFSVRPGVNVTLDLFVQQGLKGNSHFYGNFAEKQTLFAASLIAAIGNNWEASVVYSGANQKDSDYEDLDTIGMTVNYKF